MTQGLMRHFSRTKAHRDLMLRNMVTQLFQHGSIVSTHEKCKEVSRLADRVVTMAKKANQGRHYVSELQSRLSLAGDTRKLLKTILEEVGPRYKTRNGGYTRILKLEPRVGDAASQSVLELVDMPVLDSAGELKRGNMRLWLACKATIADELSGLNYTPLTLQNLYKLSKFKTNVAQFFQTDILAIRRFIKEKEDLEWNEVQEVKLVKELQNRVFATEKPARNVQRGYQLFPNRPART
ncbi:LAMI_0H10726g1_1 [Lachancea mirantina]|uniref:LAMI_0H10726g1_1 n=1 Tax=Lachancea mirantina TaxID=1230905 RepID=A0A1G4KGX2_9SACH|nr:LAMI_0H10726g1_1 [Lachancea mirantina]